MSGMHTPKVSSLKTELLLLTKIGDKTVDRNTLNRDHMTNPTGENVLVSRSVAQRNVSEKNKTTMLIFL